MTARPDTSAPGGTRRIGRYTLLRELGRGGIGAVHLARKDGSSEICVLKQLLVEHADNRGLARRFRREAHLTSELDHPNIARVLDAGTEDEGFYIAFEHIAGQTLTSLLQRLDAHDEWLAPSVALRIGLEVLEGLVHAHGRTDSEGRPLGLVHRDLSPNNVMLTYGGDVKIIDFGLAAAKIDDFKTAAGQFIGTLRYMSPEQAMTKPVDPRADLYTVAVVLYEMLTRTRVVPKATVKETLRVIIEERPPALSSVVQGLPPALSAVLARALEKSPDARYP
ncbi:serine/threonine protein kinase, partial [Myxococcota bacterium]|nr:serine/threonine protein kinase [Myxococcota bacterium]